MRFWTVSGPSLYKDYCSIQEFDHADEGLTSMYVGRELRCPCCGLMPEIFADDPRDYFANYGGSNLAGYVRENALVVARCWHCGWWELRRGRVAPKFQPDLSAGFHAKICSLNFTESSGVFDDLSRHLTRNWNDRKFISPSSAEEIVRGILSEHFGVEVEYFGGHTFHADQGIDLAVGHRSGIVQIAVQVKRRSTKNPESVATVRDFVGALAASEFKKGIFVTTATRFSAPAKALPNNPYLKSRRIELELVDGERLLEMLRETVRKRPLRLPPWVDPANRWYAWDDFPHTWEQLLETLAPEELTQGIRNLLNLLAQKKPK